MISPMGVVDDCFQTSEAREWDSQVMSLQVQFHGLDVGGVA